MPHAEGFSLLASYAKEPTGPTFNKRQHHLAAASAQHGEVVVKLKEFPRATGTRAALLGSAMTSVNSICPISARPAFFGSRRIAPAAATSRSKAWGARPAVEELRPAHSSSSEAETELVARRRHLPVASFVAHVLGQYEAFESVDAKTAAQSYESAARLHTPWHYLTTSL